MTYIFILLLALLPSSFGDETITFSAETQFIVFIKDVNSKTNYSGTTVRLDSDITFSKTIDPIGKNEAHQFRGVFDGQGHIISNLNISSTSNYTGLFGYSDGLTIKNVVLDSSCSITSMISGPIHAYVGGIIGRCDAVYGRCNIENCVNMADVTFGGSIGDSLFIGGVIGYLSFFSYNILVKNCVNYGSVINSGAVNGSYSWAELGGIVGVSTGNLLNNTNIQNCLNYGAITHNGTSTKLMIGGIVGNSAWGTYIENCVSAGKISTPTTATGDNFIGSIVGQIVSGIHINYCYYTSDVNVSSINGTGTPNSTTGTPDTPTDVGSDLVGKLNSNATSCNWDKWFMLHPNGGSINNLEQELLVEIQIRIPDPAKEGYTFLYWCMDDKCIEVFDPETEPISGNTALYAGWIPNNYTVTFNVSGGNELSDSEATKTVTFNEKYGELPKPKKEGYMFLGWFTNENDEVEVTNETIVITPCNHTPYAHWEEVTNQVEIVFNAKDLTEKEVKELIEQYTKAYFEITKFGEESGGIKVIIKFDDKKEAENFIENIKGSSEMENIKKIYFCQIDASFSAMIYPLSFLSTLFL